MYLDINRLTFGSDDAELDEKRGFLDSVFLKTSIFNRIKASRRELVIGRKGAGKSAVCIMLKKAFEKDGNRTILLTPKSFSQQKLTQLKTDSINEDETYMLSWKYAILTTIGLQIISDAMIPEKSKTKTTRASPKKIREFLIRHNVLERTLLGKASKSISSISKFSIKAFGVEGTAESRQVQTNTDLSSEVENFQEDINSYLKSSNQLGLVLLIDRVDDIWNQTKESEMMITGLIKAVHELNIALQATHIILFLRSDIYDVLKFNDADKFHSHEERIRWKDEDLKQLIATRGKFSARLQSENIDQLWDSIFEIELKGQPSFEYMLSRTLKRPRELIQFCNTALAEAQDNSHKSILSKDILAAENQYSNWKLKDLSSEYMVQYPYLEELLSLFQGFKSEFSVNEFNKRYEDTRSRLSKFPEMQSISSEKMLQILFIIGFLGAKITSNSIFVYDDPLIVLAQQDIVIVHPAYHLALGLNDNRVFGKNERSIRVGDIINVKGEINIGGRDIVAGAQVTQNWWKALEINSRNLKSLKAQLDDLNEQRDSIQEKISASGADVPVYLLRRLQDIEDQIKAVNARIQGLTTSVVENELLEFVRKFYLRHTGEKGSDAILGLSISKMREDANENWTFDITLHVKGYQVALIIGPKAALTQELREALKTYGVSSIDIEIVR